MPEPKTAPKDLKILSEAEKAVCQGLVDHAKTDPTKWGGEPAIALGRGAGAALLLGDYKSAEEIWLKLESFKPGVTKIYGMPTLGEFYEGYKANAGNFLAFTDRNAFPEPGEAFSNACGSFARVLAHMIARSPAEENTVPYWAYDWGRKALEAAGLERAAAVVKGAPDSVRSWVALTSGSRTNGGQSVEGR